jgi:hypothetical protein
VAVVMKIPEALKLTPPLVAQALAEMDDETLAFTASLAARVTACGLPVEPLAAAALLDACALRLRDR